MESRTAQSDAAKPAQLPSDGLSRRLSDDEFVLLPTRWPVNLEGAYPVYTTFVEMPGVTDTVDMVVVTTIVDELNADGAQHAPYLSVQLSGGAGRASRRAGPPAAEGFLQLLRRQGERGLQHHVAVLQRHTGRHDRHVADSSDGGRDAPTTSSTG